MTARPPATGGSSAARSACARSGSTWSTSLPDRKSTRLNSSHANISYAVFCLKKKHLALRGSVLDTMLEINATGSCPFWVRHIQLTATYALQAAVPYQHAPFPHALYPPILLAH